MWPWLQPVSLLVGDVCKSTRLSLRGTLRQNQSVREPYAARRVLTAISLGSRLLLARDAMMPSVLQALARGISQTREPWKPQPGDGISSNWLIAELTHHLPDRPDPPFGRPARGTHPRPFGHLLCMGAGGTRRGTTAVSHRRRTNLGAPTASSSDLALG